jgi:hypothetical protein
MAELVREFLRDYRDNEGLFCRIKGAIILYLRDGAVNLTADEIANCPSPPLELGNELLLGVYDFVYTTLIPQLGDLNIDRLIEQIQDIEYFENAMPLNNSNSNFETARNNNNNNNNNRGYNANNELNMHNESNNNNNNNNSSTAAAYSNNYVSEYGWSGNNNSASVKSFRTAKGGKRRTVRRVGRKRGRRRTAKN